MKYYIYHVYGVKIGCTNNPKRRIEYQQGYGRDEYEILEVHYDIHKASDRELELQLEYGYEADQNLYWEVVNNNKDFINPRVYMSLSN